MKKRLFFFVFYLISILSFAGGPEVERILYYFENNHLFVSFSLRDDFFSEELIDAINSTEKVEIKYYVQILKRRTLYIDKTVCSCEIIKSVQYDNLTNQYELITKINGEKIEEKVLMSLSDVKMELSKVDYVDMGLITDLSPGENLYYLRVKAVLYKTFFLYIFPKSVDTGWKERNLKTP